MIFMEKPTTEILVGELGLLDKNVEVELDGDKKTITITRSDD